MKPMKKIAVNTETRSRLADIHTPVGIYLRIRDRFRDSLLLESTDHHAADKSYSFICINAIAGIEIKTNTSIEIKYPGEEEKSQTLSTDSKLADTIWSFMQQFEFASAVDKNVRFAQGLYGYFSFDAVQLFESIRFKDDSDASNTIPLARYRLYQYVIAINHFNDQLTICENKVAGIQSEIDLIESLIGSKDVPLYPFGTSTGELSNLSNDDYLATVKKGIASCHRGDVFQIVLSRRFEQNFAGDEFNVYRHLRNINPSPYLFFYDYGDYRLMGSSPEAQLKIEEGKAIMHPIAGTFARTGEDEADQQRAEDLLKDPKENAEHVMLVDLARNDLSTVCNNVEVSQFRKIQYYSHVIHLVSEVIGDVERGANPFKILFKTFPAGTLSGAPKYKAMQLISEFEPTSRSFYGGAIGFVGFNGSCNHAIMIRSILTKNNRLFMQAGAGVVAASDPQSELNEVNNKLNALRKAIAAASNMNTPVKA